ARSVPKSQYDRVRSGWRACVLEQRVESRPQDAVQAVTDPAPRRIEAAAGSPPADTRQLTPDVIQQRFVALLSSVDVDATHMWLGAAMVLPALGLLILAGYVRRRNHAMVFMTQFAYLFVREFERPLLQNAAEPAIRAQLRVSTYRTRLEICLAPGKGRR